MKLYHFTFLERKSIISGVIFCNSSKWRSKHQLTRFLTSPAHLLGWRGKIKMSFADVDMDPTFQSNLKNQIFFFNKSHTPSPPNPTCTLLHRRRTSASSPFRPANATGTRIPASKTRRPHPCIQDPAPASLRGPGARIPTSPADSSGSGGWFSIRFLAVAISFQRRRRPVYGGDRATRVWSRGEES
jgi:hypothetical protein